MFKADGPETKSRYSNLRVASGATSTQGPGAHSHPEDDIFYVTRGTMSLLLDNKWVQAEQGAFVLVPGGTTHDFENRSDAPAAVLNLSIPGPFEPHMPDIVKWFMAHPPGHAGI